MLRWLRGWLGRGAPADAARGAPRPASPPAQPAAAAVPRTDGTAPAAGAAFGRRAPLVGRDGRIAGFECRLPPAQTARLAQQALAPVDVALHVALLGAAAQLVARDAVAVVPLAGALLRHAGVAAAVPAGALIVVDAAAAVPPATAAALRARGVRLGCHDGPPQREPPVDALLLACDPAADGSAAVDALLLSAQRWREVFPRITVVATGLPHVDAVERVLRAGVHLAGGRLGRIVSAPALRELGSAAHRICALLNHLALDRPTETIAEAVRADPALSLRLLRYAASPGLGFARAVDSVDQAVALLGRRELQRWLALQLLNAAERRQASRALLETASARGRLLELLARERGLPDPPAQFTLGLLSLAEPLLQVPAAAALAPLRLGDEVLAAVLHRRGPAAAGLVMLDAVDAGDEGGVVAAAATLGVESDRIAELADAAWQWAREASASAA